MKHTIQACLAISFALSLLSPQLKSQEMTPAQSIDQHLQLGNFDEAQDSEFLQFWLRFGRDMITKSLQDDTTLLDQIDKIGNENKNFFQRLWSNNKPEILIGVSGLAIGTAGGISFLIGGQRSKKLNLGRKSPHNTDKVSN